MSEVQIQAVTAMKKLVIILATLAFALSLGAPVFAAPRAAQTQSTTAKSGKAKSGKQHRKHSKERQSEQGCHGGRRFDDATEQVRAASDLPAFRA
jgi:hypothetical protein